MLLFQKTCFHALSLKHCTALVRTSVNFKLKSFMRRKQCSSSARLPGPFLCFGDSQETVEVFPEDLFFLGQLSESCVSECPVEWVQETLASCSTGGLTNPTQYKSALRRLVTPNSPRAEFFSTLFNVLRGTKSPNSVATDDLIGAFFLLCSGDIASKVTAFFNSASGSIAEDSLARLWCLAFPPLAVLLALKTDSATGAPVYARIVAEQGPQFLDSLRTQVSGPNVRAADFLRWFQEGSGFSLVPWLSLYSFPDVVDICPVALPPPQRYVLDFFLGGSYRLLYTLLDIDVYLHVLQESRLCGREAKDLYNSLLGISDHRSISFDVYLQFLENDFLPGCNSLFLPLFKNLYTYYDTFHASNVCLVDIYAGLSVLVKGDPLQKLNICFKCFDTDNDGSLTKQEITRLVFSLLLMLSQFSSFILSLDMYLPILIHSTSKFLTDLIWDAYNNPSGLSLPQFLDWLRKVGGNLMSWIDFLDPEKWIEYRLELPSPEGFEEEEEDDEDDDEDDDEVEEGNEEEEDENSVLPSPNNTDDKSASGDDADEGHFSPFEPIYLRKTDNEYLTFDDSSFFFMQSVAQSSQLRNTPCKVVFESLLLQSSKGLIREEDYMKVLLPYTDRSDFMKEVLMDLFEFFDAKGCHTADVLEVASSICLFTGGSKSAKLQSLFQIFSKTNLDELSLSRLSVFLTSVLLSLFMVSSCFQLKNAPFTTRIITACQQTVTAAVTMFQDDSCLDKDDCFSLETFGNWYNQGGSASCAWLELINLDKWCVDDKPDVIYSVELPPSSASLRITRTGAEKLTHCLVELPFKTFSDLESMIPKTKTLSKAEFASIFGPILLLQELFDHLDTTNTERVSYRDLMTSLSQLIDASKTDKLYHGFHLFGRNEGISKQALSRYLFVVLWTISCLQEDFISANDISVHIEQSLSSLFQGASSSSSSASAKPTPALVSFEEFAGWYNAEGCHLISWLELLDIRKWNVESEELVFSFHLNELGHRFDIFQSDVQNYSQILKEGGISTLGPGQLWASIQKMFPDETIQEAEFTRVIPRIFPSACRDDKSGLASTFVQSVFIRLQGPAKTPVSRKQLLVGLCPMTRGDKSSKLQFAFGLMSQDDTLDTKAMGQFLTCLLTFVLCLSRRSLSYPLPTFAQIVSSTVEELTSKVFESPTAVPGHMSFEEFAGWYMSQSSNPLQWIELMSQAKWGPSVSSDAADSSAGSSSSQTSESKGGISSILVFSLPLQSTSMPIKFDQPCELLNSIISSGLSSMGIDDVQAIVEREIPGETVSLEEYRALLASLQNAEQSGQSTTKPAFEEVHRFFSQGGSAVMTKKQVLVALLLMSGARKSSKLAKAFETFSSSADGSLTRAEFSSCMASLFGAIFASVAQRPSYQYCRSFMDALFGLVEECVYLSSNRISLEDLARWYEEKGSELAPWIELLNLEKWPANAEELPSESESDAGVTLEPAPPSVLSFPLSSALQIDVTPASSERYLCYVESTRLNLHDPCGIADMFEGGDSSSSSMSSEEFRSALSALIPSSASSEEALSFLCQMYERFRGILGDVSRHFAATSLMLFAKGKKSNKLVTAFSLFADSDGFVSASSLSEFLFGILGSILLFLKSSITDETLEMARAECVKNASSILGDKENVTFADFCEWYDSIGCDRAPWIELLDFSKWPAL